MWGFILVIMVIPIVAIYMLIMIIISFYNAYKDIKNTKKEEENKLKEECRKEEERRKQIELMKTYHTQLEKELEFLGVSLTCQYNLFAREGEVVEHAYLEAPEDVDIKKLIQLLNEKTDKCKYNCFVSCMIIDLNEDDLIEITINTHGLVYLYNSWNLVFHQEDREDIKFDKKQIEDFLFCYLGNRKIKRLENNLETIIANGISQVGKLSNRGTTKEKRIQSALKSSKYDMEFQKRIDCLIDKDMLIVDYELPNTTNISDIKEYKYLVTKKEISTKKYTDSYIAKRYENVLYSIALRSLYEIFFVDKTNEIKVVTFNGFVTQVNLATGTTERKCILSIQVEKNKFSQINLSQVEPKACFKGLKGVSAARLVDISPITPILTFNKKDKRFVEGKDVSVNQGTNLAAMHWEDFEHLVRELFEMEFARNGGEVRVTQASRDGGVDAIIFDPDPLRGGKIVVQAKRYTNTVGVSAVRDLYGTVINEGANTGILITTSDYGHDSYEFAKDKPLKLLNGGHLLALLHKNGRSAHINIEEAKTINDN